MLLLRVGPAAHRTGQDRKGQVRTRQDRTGQDRTGQDRTGQDRTGQDRTGQNMAHGIAEGKGQREYVKVRVDGLAVKVDVTL